jgi:hypothetical protein
MADARIDGRREFDSGMISRNHYERGALADTMEKKTILVTKKQKN